MSLDVTVGGNTIPTNPGALKDFRDDLNLVFSLESKLAALLDTRLGEVPASAAVTSVVYSGAQTCWSPGGGPVQFGLQGGASGMLKVVNGGTLVTYTDGLDQTKTVAVDSTDSYVSLSLRFNLSANASASYSSGTYGVKAALDTSESYVVQFCKRFAPSTPVRSAIAQTFESFVLPLHSETLLLLSDGDYLLHEFDGNLHLAFGAYAGLDRVFYAGQASIDVLKSFASPLATLKASAATEANAGVGLDFKFSYAGRFEALLTRSGTSGHLQLFRSAASGTGTTLKAGLAFDSPITASVAGHTDELQKSMVSAAGGPDTLAGKALGKVLSAGVSAIGDYVADATDKLTAWVNKADGLHTNLQVAIENSRTRSVLAGYTIDMDSPAFAAAWNAAISGDFLEALATGAVRLDAGSGLEKQYRQKTSFSCNVFNLWSMETWEEFASKVSLVYAGNNAFHLVANIGRTTETHAVGAMHSLNFYFTANADVSGQSQVTNAVVDLHIDLTAQSDPKAAATIATMLGAIGAGPASDALAHRMRAFATNATRGTVQLLITIPAAAYALIACHAYLNGKPSTESTGKDLQNWNAFALAANDLSAWPLGPYPALQTFTAWEELNEAATGLKPANRMQVGEPFTQWPPKFPAVSGVGMRTLLVSSLLAGQSFINFCADLRELAHATDRAAAAIRWESLIKEVTDAIQADVEIDFARPAALAIIRLCGTQGAVVSGPMGLSAPVNHFAVSLRLA